MVPHRLLCSGGWPDVAPRGCLLRPSSAIILNNANWSLAWVILSSVQLFAQAPASHFYLELPHWPDGAQTEITALDLNEGAAVHLRTSRRALALRPGWREGFQARLAQLPAIARRQSARWSAADSRRCYSYRRRGRDHARLSAAAGGGFSFARSFHCSSRLILLSAERSIPRKLVAAGTNFASRPTVTARILFPFARFTCPVGGRPGISGATRLARWRVLRMSDSGEATERGLARAPARFAQ